METGNLLEKVVRVMMVKMIKEPRRGMDAGSRKLEVFNREFLGQRSLAGSVHGIKMSWAQLRD